MIWIRADAGKEIGTGHVMRCLSIASALKERGQEVLFVLADDEAAGLLAARRQEYTVLHTAYSRMEEELSLLLPMLEEKRPDLLLVDSYFVTPDYLWQVGNYTKTAYVDDTFSFPHPVDVVINYNIYGDRLPYKEKALPRNKEFLLGCDYVPLRKEFGEKTYQVKEQAKDVLITTGGSDKYNLACRILEEALACSEIKSLTYHVISGAFNVNHEELQKLADRHPNVFLYRNVANMAELMEKCDIAVTAGGSTMYELCAVGVPIISFSFVDNQEKTVETFVEKGLVCYGGNYLKEKNQMSARIAEAIRYLKESGRRQAYSQREKSLVDGAGADRIAERLINLPEIGETTSLQRN